MKAPICWAKIQKTAIDASTFADTPELGQGEVLERPMAVPNDSKTKEMAAARKAPAITAPHSTKLCPCDEWLEPGGGVVMGVGPTVVMVILFQVGVNEARASSG
jgi:hypothetical protein